MKKLLLAVAFVCLSIGAYAQNLTTVSGSNITDINGTKLAAGQVCFLITDQSDTPISVSIGGGGQALKRGFCSAVTAGVITGFTVPNPANTLPTGIYYRITVKDSSSGLEVLRYTTVSFVGSTFNFDNYAPLNLGSPAPLSGNSVTGNLAVTGNVAATGTVTGSNIPASILQQIFNAGTGLNQRTAVNFFAGLSCLDNAGTLRTDCRQGQLNTVTFSATPTFDCSLGGVQKITLTANVTSSSLSNCIAGQFVAFEVCENATGGFTFAQPAGLNQWIPILTTANACSSQQYTFDTATTAFPDLSVLPTLTGDVTNSGNVTTVGKVNGVSYPASPSTHAVPVTTAANTDTYKVIPDCTDTGGNHINYTQSTDAFSCGTSGNATAAPGTGIAFAGSTSGTTTVKASATASGTLTLPAATGTLSIGALTVQTFNASGTHTILCSTEKATVVGGGAAGGGASASNTGSGGGSGGVAIKWLSGLTPGNTLTVTVGAGGTPVSNAAGGNGAATTVASGTQTISTITANGGNGGAASTDPGPGSGAPISTGGDINGAGVSAIFVNTASTFGGAGGSTFLGGAGSFVSASTVGQPAVANTGSGGGGASIGATNAGGAGAAGTVYFECVK